MLQKAEIPMSVFCRWGIVDKAKEYVAKDIFVEHIVSVPSGYCEWVYPVSLDLNGMARRT